MGTLDNAMAKVEQLPDLSKQNYAGVGTDPKITEAANRAIEAREDYANSLEQRYAQPNWFKISAAFGKPQLGGFGASLGSAAEALGENVEQQRAIAPTIAQMRAQNAAQRQAVEQKMTAQRLFDDLLANPNDKPLDKIAQIGKYDQELAKVAQERVGNLRGLFSDIIAAKRLGGEKTGLYGKYPKDFVDMYWDSDLGNVPNLGMNPNLPKPKTEDGSNSSNVVTKVKPLGVPDSLLPALTQEQSQAAQAQQINERVEKVNKQLETYKNQALASTPIFETTKNLYELAAPKYMDPAFNVFGGRDPMSVLGRAIENQTVSEVLKGMRENIIKAHMTDDDKNKALTNLNVMENMLGQLQTQMITAFPNPTDLRTSIESGSVPGTKGTKDAFMRGIAHIGSDALGKYEIANVFNQFLNRHDADINDWATNTIKAPEYAGVMSNIQKRNNSLLRNEYSPQLPYFFQNGLEHSYRHNYEEKKPEHHEEKKSSGESKKLSTKDLREMSRAKNP